MTEQLVIAARWVFFVGWLAFFAAGVALGWSVYVDGAAETRESIWRRFWTPSKHLQTIDEHRRLYPYSKSRKRMFACYVASIACLIGLALTVAVESVITG